MIYIIIAAAIVIAVLWLTKLDDKAQAELNDYVRKEAEKGGYE